AFSVLLILALVIKQSPLWLRKHFPHPSILTYQPAMEILSTWKQGLSRAHQSRNHHMSQSEVQEMLVSLKHWPRKEAPRRTNDPASQWPLFTDQDIPTSKTRKLREQFGFPPEGP